MNSNNDLGISLCSFLWAVLFFYAATAVGLCQEPVSPVEFGVVPKPRQMVVQQGQFDLPAKIRTHCSEAEWTEQVNAFGELLPRLSKGVYRLEEGLGGEKGAILRIGKSVSLSVEAYSLQVSASGIELKAGTDKGVARGLATLLQLIGQSKDGLPLVSIEDEPSSSYRSFMIDMGRNPHSLALLKETVDMLWFYKVDSLHLHLTDDQRFAFPSKAFPKLWDQKVTWEELKGLAQHAAARGVTIIPELDVPGHSTLLRRQYPEVFGESTRELAESPESFEGIKRLLDEMMEVFPDSPFIHIGGDEAGGVPESSQRRLINRLHKYLKSRGRQTIVWEGPGPGEAEDRVNSEVIHINWRTINYPADQMLSNGHRVVNAAWDPLYIVDHYPRINFTMTSPQHIYESLSLTTFKHVNPQIRTYEKPVEVEPHERLIGFCMPWWEGREVNFVSQNFPRIAAFAEAAWNADIERDFRDFTARYEKTEVARMAAFYPVEIKASQLVVASDGVFHGASTLELENRLDTPSEPFTIRYTIDGSEPTSESSVYSRPFELSQSTTVRAALFSGDQMVGHGSRRSLTAVQPEPNLALGKPVTSSVSSGSPFSVERITDGGLENLDFYLGYPALPEPIQITIDLEEKVQASQVNVVAYTISNSFEKYTVEVSVDGKEFTEVASRMERPEKVEAKLEHKFEPRELRYVRILSHGNHGYVFDAFSKIVEVQVFE